MTENRMNKDMDAALAVWARDDRADEDALARLFRHADGIPQQAPATPRRWFAWAASGAIAASVAVAMLFAFPQKTPTRAPEIVVVAGVPESDFAGQASFSLLYTPTADEEQLL